MSKKPRVRFCWHCGAKLYGNHYKEEEIDGFKRIVHKTCSAPDRECSDDRWAHLKQASESVNNWPQWKKDLAGIS